MISTGMTTRSERIGATALACVGLFALVLQYYLVLKTGQDLSWGKLTLRFFSYFTIQANILVVLMLLAYAMRPEVEEWAVHPFDRSGIASYIIVVALVYVTTLRELWSPQGAQWVADVLLHYFMPLAYLAFWLVVMHKAGLRWYDPLLWLIYPVFYLAFVLVHGRFTGFYPYPFIDVAKLGYAKMLLNAAGIALAFVAAGYVVLVISRRMARREPV
jgi:hypothetical protein